MTAFQLPIDVLCLCRDQDKKDAVTGHALFCPQHKALMAELFKPQPKDVIMDNPTPPTALPSINWRVHLPSAFKSLSPNVNEVHTEFLDFYAPHCNVNENGVLAVGGPGEVLAILAPGSWSRIENLDAIVDGVARVRAE